MAAFFSAKKIPGLYWMLLPALCAAPACAAELAGRVVDAMEARVFSDAIVQARRGSAAPRAAKTDAHGFFRLPGLTPGAYLLDVELPGGRDFVARLVLLPNRKTQFLELDYSRIIAPDDEDY